MQSKLRKSEPATAYESSHGRVRHACFALFVCASLLASHRVAMAQGESSDRGGKQTDAIAALRKEGKKALAEAAKLARVPSGSEHEVRVRAIESALEAFAGCIERFGKVPSVVADGEFRRGQLFAKLQRVESACSAFERAADTDTEVFGARAWLEKAHVLRRHKRYTDALAAYRRSASLPGARYAGQARLWVGKTLVSLGRVPDARTSFEELARDSKADARLRVQAFDELAMSWIRDNEADAAARIHTEVDNAFATEVAGDDKAAIALARAIERMRSKKSLARLRAKRS
ncbi:MAG: tetratricopeptide repeat protein [Planctomycetes bacterium]|nr:tetratricopeptide repeat protein [Planctomycetota bacterium]MCB9917851.1 tetratricopeptide repeat protein [Planctomycetota bacterium]